MKFLIHLLGVRKLGKEKNQCIRQKTGAQNIVKEIKQYQRLRVQFLILLMMGAVTPETCRVALQ